MKVLLRVSIFVLTLFVVSSQINSVHADSTAPFAPYSVEGNPDEEYHFESFFPLFKYIRPKAFKIYENRDRSRKYDPYMICESGDQRDYVCAVDNQTGEEVDGCDGGPVDICHRDTTDVVYTAESSPNGSCSANADPELPGITKGRCSYKQRPSISRTVKGTDFSGEDLIFPKLQNEANAYGFSGDIENPITYGSHQLFLDSEEKIVAQLMVLKRAKQTKNTVNITGEWPLGWVDWGYKDSNMTKSLIEIHDELPDNISAAGMGIVEADDDFFLTGGNIDIVSDESKAKQDVAKIISQELAKASPAEWAKDFATVPIYPPSFRQGFIRPTICVWNVCCPKNPDRCWVPDEMIQGIRRGLYYDISISQAFNAALREIFVTYPLKESIRIFKDLAATNPLIRYAGSASVQATPTEIHKQLYLEMKDGCLKYVPWSRWQYFTQWIDYLDPTQYLDPAKKCPNYDIQPELTKDKGGAYPKSNLSWLLQLFWNGWGGGNKIDEVEIIKYHLITIPDAMGQSISEIQQYVYDTKDTLEDLSGIKDFNQGLSNTVDDEAELLYSGKSMGPANSRRHLAYYTCNDDMFSSQQDTSIEAYALGTRIGCNEAGTTVPEGKCDGQLFAKLLSGSKYGESSGKAESYFNSNIKGNLTPELMNTYAAAEKATGVPCEILAGIHFVEASNNPQGSLVSGRTLGTPEPDAGGKVFRTLLDTAIYAGKELKGKVGGNLADANVAITALSRYNGGGNSNCQVGYPYKIPYGGCPRLFEGEDDPYPTSFLDNKHNTMYLLYCADHTACAPQVFERPGSFAVALAVYNNMTKTGYQNADLPKTPQKTPPPSTTTTKSGSSGFFPKSCGQGTLSTALGCIPYTARGFATALLSFFVGIAGAIALITMLVATFQIMTAGGDAKKLSKGKELFGSAVMGLLFLIFSVTLLRIIAGDIIKLPGFQ